MDLDSLIVTPAGILAVRDFDIIPNNWNFFDRQFSRIHELEAEINAMRRQMYQLMPHDLADIGKTELDVGKMGHPIVEEKGETKLKLTFDVQKFKPEEVKVKVLGNNILQVVAEHHEKSENGYECRKFLRQYSLPKGVDAANVRPMLTDDGVLTIEAAAPTLQPNERLVPIEYRKQAVTPGVAGHAGQPGAPGVAGDGGKQVADGAAGNAGKQGAAGTAGQAKKQ